MDKFINDANCSSGTQADDIIMPSEQALGTQNFLTSAHVHIISSYIISLVLSGCDGGGGPFHPSVPSSVPSSIHPSSSSRKKKMTEEEEEEEKLLWSCNLPKATN